MSDIRKVTDHFSVAPQITPEEARAAAAGGVALIINNRPDGEEPGQPTNAAIEAAAVAAAKGPVLAFCRSGTRSITAWAMGEAASGTSRDDLLRLAIAAGYDLRPALQG